MNHSELEWTAEKFAENLELIRGMGEKLQPYIILWTPELIDFVLENHNFLGGPVSFAKLKRLERSIKRGEFRLTHQGIAFSKEGDLLDGQHRLFAIKEAGLSIPLMTMFNLDRDDRWAIDMTHRGRILPFPNRFPSRIGSIINPFFRSLGIDLKNLPRADCFDLIQFYAGSLVWAAENIVATYYGRAPIKTAFARAHAAGLDPKKMLECWDSFRRGTLYTGKKQLPYLVHELRWSLRVFFCPDQEIPKLGLGPEYYPTAYSYQEIQCQCMEVLIYHYVNDTLHKLRGFKSGIAALRDGKLYTVPKMTEEDRGSILKIQKYVS